MGDENEIYPQEATVSQDYISFEDALKELNLRSAELKKLMSEGQIRGIRDGESIKFRKEEVEKLAKTKGEEVSEELLFVDEEGLDEGMATAEISEEDTLLEAEPEVLEEDIELPSEPKKTRPEKPARRAAARPARARVRREETAPANEESTWDRVLVIATAVIMFYGILAVMAAMKAQTNDLTSFLADMFR